MLKRGGLATQISTRPKPIQCDGFVVCSRIGLLATPMCAAVEETSSGLDQTAFVR